MPDEQLRKSSATVIGCLNIVKNKRKKEKRKIDSISMCGRVDRSIPFDLIYSFTMQQTIELLFDLCVKGDGKVKLIANEPYAGDLPDA